MIKKRLLSLLVLLAAVVTGAWAQGPWKSGDCTVTLSGDVLTVSGTGAMDDYEDYNQTPWYGKNIKTIVIESGVTSIGVYAFAGSEDLESVSIPASVTSIGNFTFADGGANTTTPLTVSFAEGSTPLTIGEGAFGYANLKFIDIPNRVTSIGESAFSGCSKLESVSIPASVTSIGNYAFQYCGTNAEALTVSFAEGLTPLTIGESAFADANLKYIDIPNRLTSIGNSAFLNCTHLESVSIPASVISIDEGAFYYCSNLAKVYIYATSLMTYGADAFDENAAGRKIYVLPEAVDTYKAGWPAYSADIEATTLYATSVKEGTEDAANWTVSPNPATEGQKVTITYAGTKSVKSVTAKRKTTTGNITVYFTDSKNWGDVKVYYWDGGPDWPGTPMTYVKFNEYSQKIYRAEIPATVNGIIFNGNGKQTADITTNIADGSWWYATDDVNGLNQYEAGYVGKWYEVKNVDDNKWTFTMTDGDMELDIEYNVAYPVTISDGDVDATSWSATPTEQSVGQNVTLQYTGRKKIKRITIEAASPTARTAAEATAEDLGKLIGADGNIYDDAAAATAASTTAVAMIAYVGNDAETSTTYNHGLALALEDVSDPKGWCSQAEATCLDTGHQFDSEAGAKGDMAGIDNTDALVNNTGHFHSAASAARGYNSGTHPTGTSAWFLPSAGQWDKMIGATGLGLSNLGLQSGYYWSSTEGIASGAWNFNSNDGQWSNDGKNYYADQVRACLAF